MLNVIITNDSVPSKLFLTQKVVFKRMLFARHLKLLLCE